MLLFTGTVGSLDIGIVSPSGLLFCTSLTEALPGMLNVGIFIFGVLLSGVFVVFGTSNVGISSFTSGAIGTSGASIFTGSTILFVSTPFSSLLYLLFNTFRVSLVGFSNNSFVISSNSFLLRYFI
ncbi:unknown [Clostridium sp. CAG:302]|nr:unknown [Clostridium sp. CAG:302]